jgi:KaiC/GvpD/RAD55 family RecA-like ATPase
MDVWISVRDVEEGIARRRLMYILKSRGMGHSNQVREFRISENGLNIISADPALIVGGPTPVRGNGNGNKKFTARQA